MMKILAYACLFIITYALGSRSYAQIAAEREAQYLRAKELIREKKYQLAAELLQPLTLQSPDNRLAASALYLYAIAQYHEKNYPAAQHALHQLQTHYPNWNEQEIHYLLATLFFEQGNYSRALQTLPPQPDKNIHPDIKNLKLHFLAQSNDIEMLKKLQKEFPQDREVGEVVAHRLLKKNNKTDQALLQELNQQFKFYPEQKNTPQAHTAAIPYQIALLFPFQISQEKLPASHQFLLDFYAGCQIALDSLEKIGIKLRLWAFDTERKAEKIEFLAHQAEFSNIDVVVGPVYADEWKNAQHTLANLPPLVFNPFSDNDQLTEIAPHIFLAQSSVSMQAQQAARLAENNFITKRILILYQNNRRDSTIAHLYQEHFKQRKDTVYMQVLKAESNETIQRFLQKNYKDSLCHAVIVSNNSSHVQQVMTFLDLKQQHIPIVVFYSSILTAPNILVERLKRHQVHVIYPDYIDYEKPIYQIFKQKYLKKYNLLPSVYACKGYDLLMFLGQNLHQQGKEFYKNATLDSSQTVLNGYKYYHTKSNLAVPFVYINEENDLAIRFE